MLDHFVNASTLIADLGKWLKLSGPVGDLVEDGLDLISLSSKGIDLVADANADKDTYYKMHVSGIESDLNVQKLSDFVQKNQNCAASVINFQEKYEHLE